MKKLIAVGTVIAIALTGCSANPTSTQHKKSEMAAQTQLIQSEYSSLQGTPLVKSGTYKADTKANVLGVDVDIVATMAVDTDNKVIHENLDYKFNLPFKDIHTGFEGTAKFNQVGSVLNLHSPKGELASDTVVYEYVDDNSFYLISYCSNKPSKIASVSLSCKENKQKLKYERV